MSSHQYLIRHSMALTSSSSSSASLAAATATATPWRRKNSLAQAAATGAAGFLLSYYYCCNYQVVASNNNKNNNERIGVAKTEPLVYLNPPSPHRVDTATTTGTKNMTNGSSSTFLNDRRRFVDTFISPTGPSTLVVPPQERLPTTAATSTATIENPPHTVSIQAIKNARITMEDEYCIHDHEFYAIFDGHGGGGVSKYLKNHLYDKVKHYQTYEAPARALQTAFADIERHVTTSETLRYQGSTAVVVWITPVEIIAANVGDSRAVLSRQGQAIPLTRDHKPNDEMERDRIFQMGETISWDRFSKVHRVKNLSLSRAIGDAYAKPVVSATVDIKHFPRHPPTSSHNNNTTTGGDEFVILASDGLWDVVSSEDAVQFCHDKLAELDTIPDPEDRVNAKRVLRRNMAKFLTREAVARGSGDNVCVVMIWLDDKDTTSS